MTKKVALVITTYQSPHALGLCLESLVHQTEKDFTLHICEDGNDAETRAVVDRFRSEFRNGIEHRWHEDLGYRKAKINNDVFRELGAFDVVICVDGDTIEHFRFVEDHLKMHENEKSLLFMGRRVELGRDVTEWLREDRVRGFTRGLSWSLIRSAMGGQTRNAMRALRVRAPFLQKLLGRDRVPDLLGSNYSLSRDLLFRVNGYDEDYQSYWGEDGDLYIRIRNSGAKIIGLKGYAIQYHLDHPRRDPSPEHREKYEKMLARRDYVRCENGITKNSSV